MTNTRNTTADAPSSTETALAPASSTSIARRTWEPRTPTAEPLVELTSDGKHAPTGRRVAVEQRKDGRGGYGLDERENVAFYAAVARLNAAAGHNARSRTADGSSIHTSEFDYVTRDEARYAGGLQGAARIDALRDWRAEFPLPTSFEELPANDPSNNYVPDGVDPSQPGADPNVTDADRKAFAESQAVAFVPATDTPLDPDEEAAAHEEALRQAGARPDVVAAVGAGARRAAAELEPRRASNIGEPETPAPAPIADTIRTRGE